MADRKWRVFREQVLLKLKESKLFYKEQILFPIQAETYTLEVYQAMRKNGEVDGVNELEGITDVGFRIEKIE